MVVCVIVCRFAVFGGFVRLLVVSEWFVFGCIGEFSVWCEVWLDCFFSGMRCVCGWVAGLGWVWGLFWWAFDGRLW